VRPCTPILDRASLTSSSLNGLMIASTFFISLLSVASQSGRARGALDSLNGLRHHLVRNNYRELYLGTAESAHFADRETLDAILDSACLTSSSLSGLMIASIFFISLLSVAWNVCRSGLPSPITILSRWRRFKTP
jgi:hypothetical protein